ncbi:MAG: diadenylate cyclase CdaA [Clostridia bacterium]|nr:diadenylate cyclase CdaA [Clostridia bacterium]
MSIGDLLKTIASGFSQFSVADAFDILLISILIYALMSITSGTRAYQVLKGVGIILIVTFICELFDFAVINWLLGSVLVSGILIIIVLFQPELRRALEFIGRRTVFEKGTASSESQYGIYSVNAIHRAVLSLSKRKVGALIVIEQKTGLEDIISNGVRIDGILSDQLLENIFEPKTPLHDGAVIIRGDTIVAASCFLPLSDDSNISKELGTRHRASIGISANSDSITIVVSEETGTISIAKDGRLTRYIDSSALKDTLDSIYITPNKNGIIEWLKGAFKNGT